MRVVLKKIIVEKNRIDYEFVCDARLECFFDKNVQFFIKYEEESLDFSCVPGSILAIPFVTNLLPLCWIFDIKLEVDELDDSFFKSIPEIKKGFCEIYPEITVGGELDVKRLEENYYESSGKATCLFSGGADATFTLLRHKEEKPTLINVWGVDIGLNDLQGHGEVDVYCKKVAAMFQTEYICIKSSLRSFFDESFLNKTVYPILGDYWWHGAQHSIGLLSLLAPYNYVNRIGTNYIASTFTKKEFEAGVKCISYPVVDDMLRMADTRVCHDGFEFSRIDKIKSICDIRKRDNLQLDLKVCFNFVNGKNCCKCEKCFRTILAILVFDDAVERYGFSIETREAKEIYRFLVRNEVGTFRWLPIQEAYRSNPWNRHIKWLETFKFNDLMSIKNRMSRLIWKLRKIR